MYYLLLLVAVVVAVLLARRRIHEVEGDGSRLEPVPAAQRWATASGIEKAAFIVMGLAAAGWLVLIIPIFNVVAVGALAYTVWKRPYLAGDLAPVAIGFGALGGVLDFVVGALRDTGLGAAASVAGLIYAPWLVIGVLLLLAGGRTPSSEVEGHESTP